MSIVVSKISLWDRIETGQASELDQVLAVFESHHPDQKTELIRNAYESACQAHDGQMRKSGDSYITHPVAVAEIIASLGLDEATIAAAFGVFVQNLTIYSIKALIGFVNANACPKTRISIICIANFKNP